MQDTTNPEHWQPVLLVPGADGRDLVARLWMPGPAANLPKYPTVEFWDRTYAGHGRFHPHLGQCTTGSYYVYTFLDLDPGEGLALDASIPAWSLPASSVRQVLHWLTQGQPLPYTERPRLRRAPECLESGNHIQGPFPGLCVACGQPLVIHCGEHPAGNAPALS